MRTFSNYTLNHDFYKKFISFYIFLLLGQKSGFMLERYLPIDMTWIHNIYSVTGRGKAVCELRLTKYYRLKHITTSFTSTLFGFFLYFLSWRAMGNGYPKIKDTQKEIFYSPYWAFHSICILSYCFLFLLPFWTLGISWTFQVWLGYCPLEIYLVNYEL